MFGFPRREPYNGKKVQPPSAEIEFQDILLDSLEQKRARDSGGNTRRLETPIPRAAFLAFEAFFLVLLGILLARSLQLQIIDGLTYVKLAEQNVLAGALLVPERGVIYDRDMTQLVFNKPSFDLIVDKRRLADDYQEKTKEIRDVASILEVNPEALRDSILRGKFAVEAVADNLDHEKILAFEEKKNQLPGFFVAPNTVRDYIEGPFFASIVGYTGKINEEEIKRLANYALQDSIGRAGLEKSYENILRGEAGLGALEKDARGNVIGQSILRHSVLGGGLVLWLDAGLQKKLTESMQRVLAAVGAKKGAAIAIDPRSGGVLAEVSIPSFDNNIFSRGISGQEMEKLQNNSLNPLFSRPVSGLYPTGSTIKPFISAAGLQEGVISEKTRIYAPSEVCLKNVYSGAKECYEDWTYHGWTDVKRAIAESINPFFYIVGGGYKKNEFSDPSLPDNFEGLGAPRIKKYLELFGWGQKTGIDIPGEAEGRVPDAEWKKNYFSDSPTDQVWRIGDTYNLSIGQGYLLATPLQVANAFAAIANGGTLYQPQFAQKIVDDKRNIRQEFASKTIREGFIDAENLEIVREGMRDAVRYGSSAMLSDLPVAAAAKTGTAQISAQSDLYYNWVSVFAPYENPEIVITIVIENVKGLQAAALPVADETLGWYFGGRL
ncbi:MAG: penicillin-binding protein 2 [Candidatus Wildermuthbacteria bacterium RIFCSPLOWO2_01_FULL_48_35]|uniref:Penicillin-binding protein 2 n=1 Tax=Candidatus Wildermuthbacteria bacterium RIFCSPLOWO2_01_FULL_48_35 TaxID=1802463 RepID=A0A1G2RNU8_9BACT|nr:MAG: penicillin-binding protein 2 [Candidatus Wildermuthbacteria bacterium RIFCSPLOWO2_01_FULL_48_35]